VSERRPSTRIPRVFAVPREQQEWEIEVEDDDPVPYRTRCDWMSVNHYKTGDVRVERWGSWKTAMLYCGLWAPNSAPDAIWRQQLAGDAVPGVQDEGGQVEPTP
jgi:hypothetical protein